MITKVKSSSYFGIDSFLVEVEVDISRGLPSFNIVGLGDTAVIESKERIRAAIRNSGYKMQYNKIIINLTPAGKRKIGTHFDLPIAIGIMCCQNLITFKKELLKNYIFMGELSLNGDLKRTQGIVSGAILAKELGYKGIVIPYENKDEGSLIKNINVIVVKNLKEVQYFLENNKQIQEEKIKNNSLEIQEKFNIDFSDVKGQEVAKRALEICAAGGHNLIMIGTPGCGKTMLAKRIMTILPPLTEEEKIEITKIYSIAGKLSEKNPIVNNRPFRSPHHTSSGVAMIGGGRIPKVGEISLANRGVLFLDELVEFKKEILENLREPLEEKKVFITRANYKVEFPCKFLFLSATNPCNCGNYFEQDGSCTCSASEVSKYLKKLSGPLIDRIDLKVEMRRLSENELLENIPRERSKNIRKRVLLARKIQKKRFKSDKLNGDMLSKDLEKYCFLNKENKNIMKKAIEVLKLSARGFDRVLKVSRTIADLDNSKEIKKEHILEALSYRISDNK
ncbi:MAG: YifB family Mg chelatase-like AAA ATPase [Fusobacterium sp. JB021]|nr:YifB family Mg chelatase-like AAA ATPase [Fusobacterium sp. JB021]MDP0506773.1 YifB family Mg chelatase-like AAA ATPase [Fusobacterium sp. JB019]